MLRTSSPRYVLTLAAWLAAAVLVSGQPPGPPEPPRPPSAARLANADEVRRRLGLPAYDRVANLESVKVAVLDSGFAGADGPRRYLPADTVVVEHYDPDFVRRHGLGDPDFRKPLVPDNAHGRAMAQIVWALTGSHPRGPRFYLLNANGPTMLRRAVRYAIAERVSVILFSGTFEGGGNFDGGGPINAIVDQAIAAGIIWVNASGNHGGCVYNGPVRRGPDGFLRFGRGDATALRFRNLLDENSVTVILTWNDYRREEDAGTAKDLDLYVEDDQGRRLGASELTQVTGDKEAGAGESRNPRERLILPDLAAAPGRDYRIRVKARSNNFTATDRLRVLVTASRDTPFRDPQTGTMTRPLQFLDASESGEIYPPADHPQVITVGDAGRESSVGPTADGRVKPDVVLESSEALFSNGEETAGSSNAAAFFAGMVVVLKAAQPGLSTGHLLALSRRADRPVPPTPPGGQAPAPPPFEMPAGPLTYNQMRALRHAEQALRERQARGEPPGGVWISSPEGPVELGIRPRAGSAGAPREAVGNRPATATPGRFVPPRSPWRTPTPEQLAELVRSRR
jgi:hypothetical protein